MRAALGAELGGTPDWSRQKALHRAKSTVHLSKKWKTRTWWNLPKRTHTGQFHKFFASFFFFFFNPAIRSSRKTAAFLGKVGHRLIMELHHLTINLQSSSGPAQQKREWASFSFWARLQTFVFIHSRSQGQLLVQLPYSAHWRQQRHIRHSKPRWGGTILVQTRQIVALSNLTNPHCA